jgi:hypothetical protein
MSSRSIPTIILAATLALASTACGALPVDLLKPGSSVWIIPVQNTSGRPAVLAVAKDESPIGDLVGTAQPAVVPAGQTIDVTFTVPGDRQGWAIFVNPTPNIGALITAPDVPPGATGKLPLTISVDQAGNPSVSVPNAPGWFGN